jgi:hypothetical protein
MLAVVIVPAAHADDLKLIKNWKDVQLYLKPKSNLVGTWDQELGIQATLFRYGNVAEVTNFAYDPTYQIRFDQKPRFTVGFQFNYFLTNLPWKVSVYTKPKASPLPYTWKDESGFGWRFYTSKNLVISSALAYVFTIPFHSTSKPQWLALVNFSFPLG